MKEILLRDGRKEWSAKVDGATVTYEWGVVGGTKQKESTTYGQGVNIGKANEMSPEAKCMFDAMVKVRKKMEKGYKVISGQLEEEVETTSDLSVPKPMLAHDLHDHLKKLELVRSVYYQPKLDGNRCLINVKTGKMYSRNRKEISHLGYIGLAVIQACGPLTDIGIDWVDGELYAPNMSFNDIQTMIRRVSGDTKVKKGSSIDTPEKFQLMKKQLKFFLFDVIGTVPFSDRLTILESIPSNDYVYVVPTIQARPVDLATVHEQFIVQGYEGAMVRFDGTPYEEKRSMSIFKWKNFQDDEFPVVGFESEKNNPNLLGAVILMDKSGQTFNARPAMPDSTKAEIWANQEAYKGKLATVKYQNLDEKSGIPRFPVLQRFRNEE